MYMHVLRTFLVPWHQNSLKLFKGCMTQLFFRRYEYYKKNETKLYQNSRRVRSLECSIKLYILP